MIHDRYYYTTLSDTEKAFYKNVYHGLQHFEKDISAHMVQKASLERVWNALHLDNPELFYVDFSTFEMQGNFISTYVTPTYWFSAAQVAQWQKRVSDAAKRLTAGITGHTDTEKELALHDRLVKCITYDHAAARLSQNNVFSHTILGALCHGTAVCDGIAKTIKWLLNAMDIKCMVALGESDMAEEHALDQDQGHAWNIVKADGIAYHLDLTWDINVSEKNHVRHDYFNLSDVDIKKDHRWHDRFPLCTTVGQDYYSLRHMTVRSKSDLHRLLASCTRANAVSFRVVGGYTNGETLINDALRILSQLKNASVGMQYSENPTQKIIGLQWH